MENKKIKITKDGPYIVTGNVPMSEQKVITDGEGTPEKWQKGKEFKTEETCALCRCGESKNKPYCDGSHLKIGFNGFETAVFATYAEMSETLEGPELILKDAPDLCASAQFCHRAGGIWESTEKSDDPDKRKTAIEEACDCPSGRLVACDKTGKAIEPKFVSSIGLVEMPDSGSSGPIWVRGGIPIESASGENYEVRNRVTLCRCGKSQNKPFCDGSHIDAEFSSKN